MLNRFGRVFHEDFHTPILLAATCRVVVGVVVLPVLLLTGRI